MKNKRSQLYCALCAVGFSSPALAVEAAPTEIREEIIVTSSRIDKPITSIPNTITLIGKEELERQMAVSNDLSSLLSNVIPGFTPGRQKMTSSGETLRGRSPLYLIDGVPQSNPLRDGARDGHTIDPAMLERVEVIHGANAIHGMGASGGVINLITIKPEKELQQTVRINTSAPTDFESEGLSYGGSYSLTNAGDNWDIATAISLKKSGVYFDANGDVVGVDNTQGDLMDSKSADLFLKTGYRWQNQSLHMMINHFRLQGSDDWVVLSENQGDIENGRPTLATRGQVLGKPATNNVTTTSLDYRADDVLGQDVHAQLFTQRFRATYGGGEFATFAYEGETVFDQSQNESDKHGLKLTVSANDIGSAPISAIYGIDFLRDSTTQILVQTEREWVPETQYRNYAPFLQLEFDGISGLVVSTGIRREISQLVVDDYQTLESYGAPTISGGSPKFSENLFNLGLTYSLTDHWQFFTSFSEGYSMPDVGRVLRGIDEPGQDVDTLLTMQPIVSDNREIGLDYRSDTITAHISYYQSHSDYGSRLVANIDGIYEIAREKTAIRGVEMSADLQVDDHNTVGFAYSNPNGRSDTDGDNIVDADLPAVDIAPERMLLHWMFRWNANIDSRLQANFNLGREFRTSDNEVDTEFEGYSTLDLTTNIRLDQQTIRIGVQNLTNTDYFTYYSQSQSRAGRYFKGIGRLLSVNYEYRF